MEILTASRGFCMGIDRAYRGMSKRASAEAPFVAAHQNSGSEFDTLRRVVRRDPELLARYPGLDRVTVSFDVATLDAGDRLVLGFHGLPKEQKDDLAATGVTMLDDLMCPFIAKLDRIVERYASAGFDVAMVGSADNHHLRTARKLAGAHGRRCFPIVQALDIDALPYEDGQPVVLVGSVTGNTELFQEVIERIAALKLPVKVMKTMCSDSYARQRTARELAQEADLVVLVDDGGDGSQSVFEVCARANPRVHRIKQKQQVQPDWLVGARKVAVVGGILVPEWTINEVAQHIRTISDAPGEGAPGRQGSVPPHA